MKNIKNTIKFMAAAAILGASVSSCSLDLLPLNDVVLENYWKEKQDVESVVASCYSGMQENGYVKRMIAWGECRSDNTDVGNADDAQLRDMMRGSLKTTNVYCDWGSLYNVINRCNSVLHYAPQVAEADPNYTPSDLDINIAECKALRAISYLTLVKTFKDVPFSFEPSIDDEAEYRIPATKGEDIIEALIQDIEASKDKAPRKYTEKVYNTAKITRAGMYSILAELYLWRAADKKLTPEEQNAYYRKCVECCDWVINFKISQYEANDIQNEDLTKSCDREVWSSYGYPLLAETATGNSNASGAATNAIFGDGGAFETIFELAYHYGNRKTCDGNKGDVMDLYSGIVVGNENIMTAYPTSTTYSSTSLFSVNTDFRSILPFRYRESGAFSIQKYACDWISCSYSGTGGFNGYTQLNEQVTRGKGDYAPNWIFYRLTEIMLFRAEAEIMIAGNLEKTAPAPGEDEDPAADPEGEPEPDPAAPTEAKPRKGLAVNGASLATAEELYDDAFNLISAVYLRSNPASKNTSSARPSRSSLKTFNDFEELLMAERQREFLFEGKRYFDLVRQARREGNTNKFVNKLTNKFGDGGAAIAIKMKQMDFMYMPIHKRQMQVNPLLKQNSAYLDEETIQTN